MITFNMITVIQRLIVITRMQGGHNGYGRNREKTTATTTTISSRMSKLEYRKIDLNLFIGNFLLYKPNDKF